MWSIIKADLRYNGRVIGLFYGLTLLNMLLLLSISDSSDTPPPLSWLPLVMQVVLTFNLLYREGNENRRRLYAALPLRPSTVALARLLRLVVVLSGLAFLSVVLMVRAQQPFSVAVSVALLCLTACLLMMFLYDRWGLIGVQLGFLLPALSLLALVALGSMLFPALSGTFLRWLLELAGAFTVAIGAGVAVVAFASVTWLNLISGRRHGLLV